MKLTETEYRVKAITNASRKLINKRVALYGSGDNARYILQEIEGLDIVALIDDKKAGQYFCGKMIIRLEQSLLLGIDTIIIAAEARSAQIVSDRIESFCISNRIELLNMYGIDEIARKRAILEQKLSYPFMNNARLRELVNAHEVICFQLRGLLCGFGEIEENAILEDFSRSIDDPDYFDNRIKAEEKIRESRKPYGLTEIYNAFQTYSSKTDEETNVIRKKEETFYCDICIPFDEMISIVKDAVSLRKRVLLYSDLRLSIKGMSSILSKLGLGSECEIIQENIQHLTLSNGLLRSGLGEDIEKKVLFVGTDDKEVLLLAQSYGTDVCIIKTPWDLSADLAISDNLKGVEGERFREYIKWIQKERPFFFINEGKDASGYNNSILINAEWRQKNKESLSKCILPSLSEVNENDFEHLKIGTVEKPKVSIIIPAHNHLDYTYNCIKSIKNNTKAVDYEIIIGDDCSSDGTKRLEQIIEGIRVIHNENNLQFIKTCNKCASEAHGEYLLFLNNDTQVMYNWLQPLVKLIETNDKVGMVGSKLIFPDGTLQEAGGIIWKDGSGANYGRGEDYNLSQFNYVKEVDYISGASIMIRKTLWQEIGGFDERFIPAYCEDSDLAFSVRSRGYKVLYQPESVVVHFEGISNGRDVDTGAKQYQVVNKDKFYEKWKTVLNEENEEPQNKLAARERKRLRKTVLLCSEKVPEYDVDTGSKVIWFYIKLLIEHGYMVKFVPRNFYADRRYSFELQQMGVEVFEGDWWKDNFDNWVFENKEYIDIAWLHYPLTGDRFMDLMKCNSIRTIYYGHDLHYVRNRREYELTGDTEKLEISNKYYRIEKELIIKADYNFFPSVEEVETVKREFAVDNVSPLTILFYDDPDSISYQADKREGMMYIGGFGHPPNIDAVKWFVNDIFPIIRKEKEINFYMVGSGEPKEIIDINTPGVINLGRISESELTELYGKVKMVVIPLRFGAGVKGKVVDALYYNVPMVSTSIGIEGIPEGGKYITNTDDASEFAKKVLELYDDDQRLAEIANNYKELVKRHYSSDVAWNDIKYVF